jgi:hypothetical protein
LGVAWASEYRDILSERELNSTVVERDRSAADTVNECSGRRRKYWEE